MFVRLQWKTLDGYIFVIEVCLTMNLMYGLLALHVHRLATVFGP